MPAALAPPARAAALEDKVFTVANYPVEGIAQNAVAAKEKAIADGQQAAFRSLLKRLVPVTAYNRMEKLKTAKASDYLDGYAVRSEQNSATQYFANLDFTFEANSVRTLLRGEGVPFIDQPAPRIVLIPVVRQAAAPTGDARGAAGTLVPATGTWNDVWQDLDLENTVTPAKIAALKPEVHADTLAQLLAGNGSAGRILAQEYKAEEIVLAVAETDVGAKRLHVTLAGTDAVGPISWKRSYRIAEGDTDYTMELAAVVSLGVIEGRWKAVRAGAQGGTDAMSGGGPDIALEVEFRSMDEWNDIRGRLLDMPGVDDLRVGAVSARSAEVSLKFPGGPGLLANELAAKGLSLRQTMSGWLLKTSF
jgi:hypothetical protein